MRWLSFFRKQRAVSPRLRSYRPILERLEDRCLLSGGFTQVDLASDVPGLAPVTDRNLVNPWGLSFSPTGPFWIAENGRGTSELLDGRAAAVPLLVTVPAVGAASGTPTGTVFNGSPGFVISENGVSASSRFLFAAEDGTISGWTSIVDPMHALVAVDNSSSGAIYTGLALGADPTGHSFLYAADFSHGTIDVFDQDFRPVVRPGSFQDPNLPDGFAPFDVQNINNQLLVTYARQNTNRTDEVDGWGQGFIDVYSTDGTLVDRFASRGVLNAPWGLALAPASFGPFGGALLVGNNGDGHISAFDPRSGRFLGQLADDSGVPIAIPNLWALKFGNGHAGGDPDTLFFTAGVADSTHGLFGAIQSPARRGADTAGVGAFDPHAPGEPGDYPLQPSFGPAFRVSNEARPFPDASLLPLRQPSLVLAPTLVPVALPAGPTAVSASGPIANEGTAQPVRETRIGAIALTSFLDVAPSETSPDQKTAAKLRGSDLATGDAQFATSAVGNAGPESQRSDDLLAGRLPLSNQPDAVVGVVSTNGGPELANEEGVENTTDAVQNSGGRRILPVLLLAVSIPVIWVSWPTHNTGRMRRP